MLSFKKINDITGWLVFTIATVVYTMTVEETASFWDCGEFIAVSYKLMVPHPPGAPLFLLIGRLFSFLAMGDTQKVAFWINMVSVLSSSFTILFLYWSITLLGRKLIAPAANEREYDLGQQISLIACGVIGALAYTFSDSFWFSAEEAEVYGLSSFFTAFVVWAMLRWDLIEDEAQGNKWLLLIAYMMGLSIGVHLLNLVTIPALGFVYYYKKYKTPTMGGALATIFISLVIIGVVMVGVIPGLPSIAGKFEILFVNSFGLPFGSGIVFFVLLFIGALVYGIRYSIVNQRPLMNLILLGFAFILIGYSSYALVLIRSNFNPPIDENDPENIMTFVSYLKREQYGDRPLLYGRTFMSERVGIKKGDPVYRKGKDKYEIVDYQTEAIYKDEVLLPRMYSQSDDHPKLYREWTGLREDQHPTFFHNVYYLFRYQLGHMYFRYFMWNFAGRDSDEKEAEFLTPVPTKGVPPVVANNKAHDNFYMLPLILGIIGFFYQLKRDEKSFVVVGLLFVLTGIAIVVYLNSPPVEPRERDYIYVGSFYAFAMWIGFGVLGVADFLGKVLKNEMLRPALAGALCLVVPGIMAAKGWDNHDRSDRFHSVDQARNTLRSCAPNAVLFTGGDNDTFPLWYVQDVEGFRTDVRVVVLSYFSTDWYIQQMKRKVYQSEALPISLEYPVFKQGKNDFVPYVENEAVKGAISLKQYVQLVKEDNPNIQVELQGGGTTAALPSKTLILPINKGDVLRKNFIPKDKMNRVVDQMEIKLREGQSVIYKSDLMILDMLANFDWNRPIYFNNTSANTTALEIRPYLQMEGMAYRLLPVKAEDAGDMGEVHTGIMHANMSKFEFRGFENPDVYHDEEYRKFGSNERSCYYRLALQYIIEDKKQEARNVIDTCFRNIPDATIPFDYDYHVPRFVELYHLIGDHEAGKKLADELAMRAGRNLKYVVDHDTFGNSSLKDFSLMILNQLMIGYRRAEERETTKINEYSAPQIPQGDDKESKLAKAKEMQKYYADQYEKYAKIFNTYYPGLMK